MSKIYWRPIAETDRRRPQDCLALGGGKSWFSHCERLTRGGASERVPISEVPDETLHKISRPRAPICGLDLSEPKIMGILNVTPDSFSDGGKHARLEAAVQHAQRMTKEGADIIDIGGESTRPGADFVNPEQEIERTVPVIAALQSRMSAPISIDTRKAVVADASIQAGASLFNDVSALTFDPESLKTAARMGVPVCLMHASGDPKTMQTDPRYEDVLLDVYDYLEARRDAALKAGVKPEHIILDPGIGFGKKVAHNLSLLRGLSLLHGLACPILLGGSRKRFIGTLTNTDDAVARMPGSVAVALEATRQGAQFIRVHDVAPTKQAMTLWHNLHY